jgi:hypothetical protein
MIIFLVFQEYYKQVEDIEELRRAVQFPKLENLPSDFLTQMEGYVKDAPRKMDQNGQEVAIRKVTMTSAPLSLTPC